MTGISTDKVLPLTDLCVYYWKKFLTCNGIKWNVFLKTKKIVPRRKAVTYKLTHETLMCMQSLKRLFNKELTNSKSWKRTGASIGVTFSILSYLRSAFYHLFGLWSGPHFPLILFLSVFWWHLHRKLAQSKMQFKMALGAEVIKTLFTFFFQIVIRSNNNKTKIYRRDIYKCRGRLLSLSCRIRNNEEFFFFFFFFFLIIMKIVHKKKIKKNINIKNIKKRH